MKKLEQLRRQTPGTQDGIHLNNAGAALMPEPVLTAVLDHLRLESRIGGYEAAEARSQELEAVYHSVARLLGCGPGEVALTDNATRSWNRIFYGFPLAPGDRVLTTTPEYASNAIAFLQRQKRHRFEIVRLADEPSGQLDLKHLESELSRGAALMCLCHVPTNGGLVQPARAVGELCRAYGVPYLLDACQSAGQMPLSVAELQCDFLTGTSRKYLRGPRGVGFLFVAEPWLERLEPADLDLHSAVWDESNSFSIRRDARRFELWEADYAARLGFGAAVDYYLSLDQQACWQRIQRLADHLRKELRAIQGIEILDRGSVQGGIVTFQADGIPARELKQRLAVHHIRVSTSSVRAARWDMQERGIDDLVRASVHYYNTEPELERFVETLKTLL